MKFLKKITKKIFNNIYNINPNDNTSDLLFACEGRIIRSLSETKKKACGTYALNGIKR